MDRTLILLVIWPMPLYASGYVFSKRFFSAWVGVGIGWILCSFIAVGLFPAWQSRATVVRVLRSVWTSATRADRWPEEEGATIEVVVMPGEKAKS